MRSARDPAVLIAAAFLCTSAALAQTEPTPTAVPLPPPLTPPAVQGRTDVEYPKAAKGDAVVLLELTIEKDGTVSTLAVTEGTDPFAEQARQAVRGWRFRPALRGATPVVARVAARVEFRQEESPNVSPGVATASPPAPPSATFSGNAPFAPQEPAEEVTSSYVRRGSWHRRCSVESLCAKPETDGGEAVHPARRTRCNDKCRHDP